MVMLVGGSCRYLFGRMMVVFDDVHCCEDAEKIVVGVEIEIGSTVQ